MWSLVYCTLGVTCGDLASRYREGACCGASNATCQTLAARYRSADCCRASEDTLVTIAEPKVCGVNGVRTRVHPEPWKPTHLSLYDCEDAPVDVCWEIDYLPRPERLHPVPPRLSEPSVSFCTSSSDVNHTFTHPGDYRVCAIHGGARECVVLSNRYVHRHVMDLTQDEFDDFAGAFNTMRRLSTEEGRAAYGHQCPDADDDFFTHDAFVSLHSNLARARTHDHVHYLTLQEPGHLAWTMLMQRSLRCVCPSCTHPYFDPVRDFDAHYDGTLSGLVRASPVWSDARYGGAENHFASNADAAFVADGRFRDFPITQTSDPDYWCAPLAELSPPAHDTCRSSFAITGTQSFSVGLSLMQPKPVAHLQKVSRRPYYWMGSQRYCINYIDSTLRDAEASVRAATDLDSMWGLVSTAVHSFGHNCISGKWTSDGRVLGNDVALGNDKAVNVGMWYAANATEHPCFKCYDDRCECAPGCADAQRWYYEYENDTSRTGGTYRRATQVSLPRLQAGGCDWPKSGTFDWSASANQDPAFYMHHYYTFYLADAGYRSLEEATGRSIPQLAGEMGVFLRSEEVPGNNLDDTTQFRNAIPYLAGQTPGSYHTWREILAYQTSHEDFVFA